MDRTEVRGKPERLDDIFGATSTNAVAVTQGEDGRIRLHPYQDGPGSVFMVPDKEKFLFVEGLDVIGAADEQKVGRRDTPGRVLGGNTKLKIGLVPMEAIKAIARVLGWSGVSHPKKYVDWDWLTRYTVEDCWESAMRHMIDHRSGEITDSESELPHLEHALTRLAMAVHLQKKGDRSPPK